MAVLILGSGSDLENALEEIDVWMLFSGKDFHECFCNDEEEYEDYECYDQIEDQKMYIYANQVPFRFCYSTDDFIPQSRPDFSECFVLQNDNILTQIDSTLTPCPVFKVESDNDIKNFIFFIKGCEHLLGNKDEIDLIRKDLISKIINYA